MHLRQPPNEPIDVGSSHWFVVIDLRSLACNGWFAVVAVIGLRWLQCQGRAVSVVLRLVVCAFCCFAFGWLCVNLFVRVFDCAFVCLFVCSIARLFACLCVCLFVFAFVCSFVRVFARLCVWLVDFACAWLCVCAFVCSVVRLFV